MLVSKMRLSMMQYMICGLVGVLVVLQVVHLTMISWLESKAHNGRQEQGGGAGPQFEGAQHPKKKMHHLTLDKIISRQITLPPGKLNTDGSYKILYNFASSRGHRKTFKRNDVTLITHCSMNNLFHIPELVDRWKGPISISVFGTTSDIRSIISYVLSLQECFAGIYGNVTFHAVYPITSLSEEADVVGKLGHSRSVSIPLVPCSKLLNAIKQTDLTVRNYAQDGFAYPNNLLRNVGRSHVLTDYHFVLDIDMLPSESLRENFMYFIQGSSAPWLDEDMMQHMVFVVPVFEVDVARESSVPRNKQELLNALDNDRARQFYVKACTYCQNHTDYPRWTSLQSFTGQLGVAYTVEWKPLWEPFYISRRDVPLYDERFRQYGYNRISQVCELHTAGYNFAVLDTAFVVHKGFKEKTEFHFQKDEENRKNYYLYLQFRSELENKYPETSRRCE